MSQTREERGLEISKSAHITENGDGSFSVPSQTLEGKAYTVKAFGSEWTCDCPDFLNRADEIDACKHIHATRFWIAAKVELRSEAKPQVFAEDAVQCARCASIRVIKYGTRTSGQLYRCKDCGHKFNASLLKKAKYSPEMVSLTLDLYFSGLSLRKVARTLNDHFGTEMGSTSVYRWIQTFVPKVAEYANSLTPQTSETWHTDELFVNMKGGEKHLVGRSKEEKSIAYLWNVMDRKTRFLLASRLSAHRNVNGAIGAFNEARKVAHDKQPEKILVDGLTAYPQAIDWWQGQKPQLIAKVGIKKPAATNNRIERMNGTLRERVKVQRGWKTFSTPLAEGQRLHYNFVKPHAALEGQTPAEMAGIGVQSENKWLGLLKKAVAS